MAKLSAIQKNLKRQKLVTKYSSKRAKLKKICCDKTISIEDRFNAQLKLSECPRNGAKIRLRNRCEVTGRPEVFTGSSKCLEYFKRSCFSWSYSRHG